jgi:hypothetical protein
MRNTAIAILRTMIAVVAVSTSHAEDADRQSARRMEAQRALHTWYNCIECQKGELEELIKHQALVQESLVQTLREGPSPVQKREIELQLRANHRSSPSQTISEDRYVELFMANISARYSIRAATALGRINSDGARKALQEAQGNERLRNDVRSAARNALEGRPIR